MIRLVAVLLLLPVLAHAQSLQRVTACGQGAPGAGASPGYQDTTGGACDTSRAPAYVGNGTLTLSTTSALLNTLTASSSAGALPATLSYLEVINLGSVDAAICVNPSSAGATCTCPANGVATTNGLTLAAGKGGYILPLAPVSSANPSVVACAAGAPVIQVRW